MTTRHIATSARLIARFGGDAELSRATDTGETPWNAGTVAVENWTVRLVETGTEAAMQASSLIVAGIWWRRCCPIRR